MKTDIFLKTIIVTFTLFLILLNIGCGGAKFSKAGDSGEVVPLGPPGNCPGEYLDPEGCLKAVCKGGVSNPRVEITWCNDPNANSNSLQKGDMYPNDSEHFWGWLIQGSPDHDYTDHKVDAGVTYYYRAKFRPETPSNVAPVVMPIDNCTCNGN